jgi:plasmid segregation protein ParM
MTKTSLPPLVAIDDGYAQTKLYTAENGTVKRFMMRSSVRPGRFGLMSLSGDGNIGSYLTAEGEEFTVSEEIEGENTQFDGFHTSAMNRVLVHHAIWAAGLGGGSVKLVTGLPVADFFAGGRRNEKKIAAKRENLLKSITSVSGETLAILEDVTVGCQALAAFVNHLLDDDLNERDVAADKVAVVDIGGRTTDIALIIDGKSFDPRRSGTENMGVLDVYTALAELIKARHGIKDEYPLAVIDKAVRTGSIKLWGKPVDVSDLVNQAIGEQQAKIGREIERRLGGAADLDAVLFVGGGSALFTDIAKMFPNGEQVDDPEFANAKGLYKYALKFA